MVVRTAWWICLAVQPPTWLPPWSSTSSRRMTRGLWIDLDPGIADRANGDRQGEALQQWKVDVDVEPLRLETGEAGGDGLEALANGIEMVQALLKTEVGEVVGDQFVAQEGGELFVLLEE